MNPQGHSNNMWHSREEWVIKLPRELFLLFKTQILIQGSKKSHVTEQDRALKDTFLLINYFKVNCYSEGDRKSAEKVSQIITRAQKVNSVVLVYFCTRLKVKCLR